MDTDLGKEIIVVIVIESGELSLCIDVATKWLSIAELLQRIQTTGNATIAVRVESVEVDGCSSINAGVELRGIKDDVVVGIDDARLCGAVCVHEVRVGVGFIVRTLLVTVTKRSLQSIESRYRLAVSTELCLSVLVGCLDCRLNLLDGDGIGLRDDERYRVFRSTSVD